jgi:AcrR family transcriptional regulator
MFADQGYSAVSMRTLADELGIQAPSLYSHFPSKDAMLLAVVEPFLAEVDEQLDRIPPAPVTATARRQWLTDAVDLLRSHPQQLQLVTNDRTLALHPTIGPQLARIRERMVECFCRFGIKEEDWSIGVTGAIVFAILTPAGSPDTATIVAMAEAFVDAR